jgi:Ser/Thr protein kinase RdoA (MazF antagonist)
LSLSRDDAAVLRRAAAGVRRRIDALALPVQAVHGDAHLGNVINTARGPLWNDWGDAFLGPVA